MGGVLILAGLLAGVIAGLGRSWDPALRWALMITFGYGLIGFLDDLLIIIRHRPLGLKARYKLFFQVFFAALLSIYVIRSGVMESLPFPFFSWRLSLLHPLAAAFFIVFVVVGASNAVNLTDGLDGLAAGSCVTAGLVMGILAIWQGETGLGIFAVALAGACAGFIWFNCPPAQVFMGDTGSLALGAALGAIGVLSGTALFLPVAGGIFVAEVLSVIIQVLSFRLTGKRVFRMSPLHHHYELGGMVESKVVIRFWLVGILLALLALAGYKP
jgi:phospho-N-acetylmuramoyl-pentapeptide-transferase